MSVQAFFLWWEKRKVLDRQPNKKLENNFTVKQCALELQPTPDSRPSRGGPYHCRRIEPPDSRARRDSFSLSQTNGLVVCTIFTCSHSFRVTTRCSECGGIRYRLGNLRTLTQCGFAFLLYVCCWLFIYDPLYTGVTKTGIPFPSTQVAAALGKRLQVGLIFVRFFIYLLCRVVVFFYSFFFTRLHLRRL